MKKLFFVVLILAALASCRGKKESIYVLTNEDEYRTLTLRKDGTFVLSIQAGYYNRLDTGTYVLHVDTLILNQQKALTGIDSIVSVDSLYNGVRFLEVYEEEVVVNDGIITESYYDRPIFPTVVVNDTLQLSLNQEDPAYRMLIIPDDVTIQRIRVTRFENNTCRPSIVLNDVVPAQMQTSKSLRIYLRSYERPEHYLAGFRWLVKGDTIESFFSNDDCEPLELKFIRK